MWLQWWLKISKMYERYVGLYAFLFWRHSLLSPRSPVPSVSDPTGSEISCFRKAQRRWRKTWRIFFFDFHSMISCRLCQLLRIKSHYLEISKIASQARMKMENHGTLPKKKTVLENCVRIYHWFFKIHIAVAKTVQVIGHVTDCNMRFGAHLLDFDSRETN